MHPYDLISAILVRWRLWRAAKAGDMVTIIMLDGEQLTGRIVRAGREVKVRTSTRTARLPWWEIAEVRRDG